MKQERYKALTSISEGHWFKLICGASFQHLPSVRNLALAYTLAGADCIDVAADPAVIHAVREALDSARQVAAAQSPERDLDDLPWLMVSLNDGEDPHFRKAEFQPQHCPSDCPQPCRSICPAQAIVFNRPEDNFSGVVGDRCYGCGRCLPICPIQHISTRSQASTPQAIGPLIVEGLVDALEIHTQVGRLHEFQTLWQTLKPFAHHLKLVAVSCPDDEGLIDYLWNLFEILSPLPCPLIWQTDGRPMSGDIGDGTTRATIKLGQKVLAAGLPGYVQLAGGTNGHTVSKLRAMGLLKAQSSHTVPILKAGSTQHIVGVAYGSFARTRLAIILDQLDQPTGCDQIYRLEDQPDLLWPAVSLAQALVSQLKPASRVQLFPPKPEDNAMLSSKARSPLKSTL